MVQQLLYGHFVDMGGLKIRQPLPTQRVNQVDPFLLFHHHDTSINRGSLKRDVGVGPHPHRGFSPVTFLMNGSINHKDSRGNDSTISEGGVQWMDSGMGIVHSERPSSELLQEGGRLNIVQLWVNTPAKNKMDQPRYQPYQREDMPKISTGQSDIRLVAGSQSEVWGPVKTYSPLTVIFGKLAKDSPFTWSIDPAMNALIYVADQPIRLTGYGIVEPANLIRLEKGTQQVELSGDNAWVIGIAGQPLNEPYVNYGPFVMNTQTELMQAMRDYQMGKMGILIED